MMDFAEQKLKAIGATVEQVDIGNQTLPDGTVLKLPNAIMATLGNVSIEVDITSGGFNELLCSSAAEHLSIILS